MLKSTKTTRRKIVQKVKAATYGTVLGSQHRQAAFNTYGGQKSYGPHRKAIAGIIKTIRHKKRHLSGINPTSKSVRGSDSLR